MNGYVFSQRVREALAAAREIAVKSRHDYVEPGHLLLALLRDGDSMAAAALARLGVDFTALARSVVGRMETGGAAISVGDALPYTSRAKKTLELAMSEARELRSDHVGTGHLLLGLMREEKGTAATAMGDLGLTIDILRAELQRVGRSAPAETPIPKQPIQAMSSDLMAIVNAADTAARVRGADTPDRADLLQALVFSSSDVAAVFASYEIDVPSLVDEIRRLPRR